MNEPETRAELIDPQRREAGWDVIQALEKKQEESRDCIEYSCVHPPH
jgi:type I site-specific restriction endonuclease